jgi:hypothetical protein
MSASETVTPAATQPDSGSAIPEPSHAAARVLKENGEEGPAVSKEDGSGSKPELSLFLSKLAARKLAKVVEPTLSPHSQATIAQVAEVLVQLMRAAARDGGDNDHGLASKALRTQRERRTRALESWAWPPCDSSSRSKPSGC